MFQNYDNLHMLKFCLELLMLPEQAGKATARIIRILILLFYSFIILLYSFTFTSRLRSKQKAAPHKLALMPLLMGRDVKVKSLQILLYLTIK